MRTKYQCTNPECLAEDTDRGTNNPAPVALNCHKCRAGHDLTIPEMLSRGVGMLPYQTIDPITKEVTQLR